MGASAGVIAVCNDGVSTPTNVDDGQGGEAVDQSASSPMLSAHKISAILPSQQSVMQMSVISAAKRPNTVVTEKVRKPWIFFQKILNGFRTSMFSRLQKIWCHQRFLFLRVIPEFSFFSAFSFRPAMDWFMVKSFMFKSESFVGVAINLASNF